MMTAKSLALGFLTYLFMGAGFGEKPARPNIVFILADDLGYGDLSCYGATKVTTPNIDRLAGEGIRFMNAYSPHSVCTPSRYALMTGQYAWRTWNGHQTVWADDPLLIDTARLTLPKLLKSAGYHTALIGKWHLGFGAPGSPGWKEPGGPDYNRPLKPGPLEIGFDYFWGVPHVGQQPNVYIENHRVVGLSENSGIKIGLDEKWQGRVSYLERRGTPAHTFTGEELMRYQQEDLAVSLTEKAVNWLKDQARFQRRSGPFFLYFAHRNVHGPLAPAQQFKGTSSIGVYGDFINELDWSIGEILNVLEREGLSKNTVVIFSSDNGGVRYPQNSRIVDYNGHRANGPFSGQKTEALEGGVHVPLLVRWPGVVQPGSKSGHLVALTDMLATLADFYHKPLPWNAGEDSFSFLHVLTGKKATQPIRENIVVDGKNGLFAIRQGPWKFIAGQGGGGYDWDEKKDIRMAPHQWDYKTEPGNPPGQLYNLEQDIGETSNLYEIRQDILVPLRATLRQIQYSGRSR